MILNPPAKLASWESVALVQLAQSAIAVKAVTGVAVPAQPEAYEMLRLANVPMVNKAQPQEIISVAFAEAYRQVELYKHFYTTVLAQATGLHNLKLRDPEFPGIPVSQEKTGIVIAPFGVRHDFDLPVAIWRSIVRHMRSYNEPVYLVGDGIEHRLDSASFAEGDMYLDCAIANKLTLLANAKLVMGVPNAWLWVGAAYTRTLALTPDNLPAQRWFPWKGDQFARLDYPTHSLQVPVMLAGLRKLIGMM